MRKRALWVKFCLLAAVFKVWSTLSLMSYLPFGDYCPVTYLTVEKRYLFVMILTIGWTMLLSDDAFYHRGMLSFGDVLTFNNLFAVRSALKIEKIKHIKTKKTDRNETAWVLDRKFRLFLFAVKSFLLQIFSVQILIICCNHSSDEKNWSFAVMRLLVIIICCKAFCRYKCLIICYKAPL